jgi:hypothetical protein
MSKLPKCRLEGIKDKAVLFGWIAGLLLLISMLWILTQPLQGYYLLRSVNSVFINNNDSRRLTEYLPVKSKKAGPFGFWFSMRNTDDRFFVFAVFQNGILVPLGAVVAANGSVNELIPLSAHAVQVFNELPDNILRIYTGRIEETVANVLGDIK